MNVIEFVDYGGPEVLVPAERPMPEPGEGEMRIRIRAAAVNPADPKWRQGMFKGFAPVPLPHVLGYDVAGVVDIAPAGPGPQPGDRVFAMLSALHKGGYAEYAVLPVASAVPIPDKLDDATAASLPTAGLTGSQMVEQHAKLSAGQTVLITGATGAVGRFALAAALQAGAQVVAAVRQAQRAEAQALGATATIALGEDAWTGVPFDHVIDTVGGPAVALLCRQLRPGGGIFTAATTPIDKAGLATEPVFIVVQNDPARLRRLAQAVADGTFTVPVARRMKLSEAAEAHRQVEQGGTGGKIILEP